MRIVVTGGSGVVGKIVLHNLVEAGHEVINASRRPPKESVAGVTFVRTDTTDMGQVVGVLSWKGKVADAVIHLAALPNVWPVSQNPPTEVWRINSLGMYHVVEACAILGIKKVSEASSVNVHQYARAADRIAPPAWPWNEQTPPFVVNAYGLSKVAGEAAMRMLHARTGAQAISIRPALVIGPDEYAARVALMRQRPKAWLSYSYTDSRDLADAFRLSVEKNNLGCDVLYVINDEAFSDEPVAPQLRAKYTAATKLTIDVPDGNADISNARAKRVLGWKPKHHWRDELASKSN